MLKLLTLTSTVACTILLAAAAHSGGPIPVDLRASGTAVPSNAADLDENATGYHSYLEGRGSLGRFTLTNAGDVSDWDGSSFCDFDPETGAPIAVELVYLGNASVLRTAAGDQLYLELDSSPPSTYCANFIDNSSTFELYATVVGGTGRFKGATGTIYFSGSGQALSGLTPFELTASGELYLMP